MMSHFRGYERAKISYKKFQKDKSDPQMGNSLLKVECPSLLSYFRKFVIFMMPTLPMLSSGMLHKGNKYHSTWPLLFFSFPPQTVRMLTLQVYQSLDLHVQYCTRFSKGIL